MKSKFFILLMTLLYNVKGGSLPSYITPCDFQDQFEKCVSNQIANVMQKFAKGIPELGVPSLDPIKLDEIRIIGNSMNLTFKEPSISGLGQGELSVFELVPDVQLRLAFKIKKVHLVSKYEIDGKILFLPIQGNGDAVVITDNLQIDLHSKIAYTEDSKGKHIKLVSPNFTYKMDKTTFQLENLFNGNKQLADTTLQVLNENWEQVMEDVAPPVVKQTVKNCIKAINQFFSKLTVDEVMLRYKPKGNVVILKS